LESGDEMAMEGEGFMAAFMSGFLGTAFPRLAGNRPWLAGEFMLLLGLWVGVVACAATGRGPLGPVSRWFQGQAA
jgi:uncharacterized protein involved in response to NO